MHAECFPFSVDAKPQCESDFDCNVDKTCSEGNCVFACSLVSCGLNAVCVPKNHRGICECNPSYYGNPTIACNKGTTDTNDFSQRSLTPQQKNRPKAGFFVVVSGFAGISYLLTYMMYYYLVLSAPSLEGDGGSRGAMPWHRLLAKIFFLIS